MVVDEAIRPAARGTGDEADGVPLLVRPCLDAKPWGGQRLERFGFALPAGAAPLGEALMTHAESAVVLGQDGDERSLERLVDGDRDAWVGRRGSLVTGSRPCFPILVKFIDAADNLSIQVHPDDAAARDVGEAVGKTEAWHVLAADPGAALYLGLRTEVALDAFVAALRRGAEDIESFLRRVPAEPGMTVLLPAGTVHALGRGVLLYEIQQPSTITYRLHDWGRRDVGGRARELHLEQGLRVLKPEYRPDPIRPVAMPTAVGQRDLLVATRLFALERIGLNVGEPLILPTEESPQVFTCLGGAFRLDARAGGVELQVGDTAIAPLGVPLRLAATMPGVVVRAWVPDLGRDVIRPARAAGAGDEAITALARPLTDLDDALRR